ncbi:MAG TPA: orotidine-5'-phosphate decarboxylase, partial [Chthoniobacterales bacterium]
MKLPAKEKIITALDFDTADEARRLLDELAGEAAWVKIGLQLYSRTGREVVDLALERGFRVFLDLKFHDIPNTVHEAIRSVATLGVHLTTIHASGGRAMMQEAVKAAEGTNLLPLAVTVLTSLGAEDLHKAGILHTPGEQVAILAGLAKESGIRALVCSAQEAGMLRKKFGNHFTLVTPGIRRAADAAGDQKRVITPGDAIRNGADYLVVGRPITGAASPREAFLSIVDEIN